MPLLIRRPTALDAPRAWLLAAGLVVCWTCNYGEVRVVEPAAVGRGPLTISIQPHPEDAAVALELGWGPGIPGAEVTVSPGKADTATGPTVAVIQTDSTGTAIVPDLQDGHYLVEARRLLTAEEAARLSPAEGVIGFMARQVVERGSDTLLVPASRRRSVVISEWSFYGDPGGSFGGFLELANNSDTTVFLDRLVVGIAFSMLEDYGRGDCATYEWATNDPDGVWTRYFHALPGTGHTYPLAPGATAVIATDAIDHSVMWPGGLDLSHADFEFIGAADVDNPSVPNTIDIGLAPYVQGHGLYFLQLAAVTFVALPLEVAALKRYRMPIWGYEYARVPRDRILDVVALLWKHQIDEPFCPHIVHPNFDRYRAVLVESPSQQSDSYLHSAHRKVAYTRADGRKILQHTRTSNTDFFTDLRTPGQLP